MEGVQKNWGLDIIAKQHPQIWPWRCDVQLFQVSRVRHSSISSSHGETSALSLCWWSCSSGKHIEPVLASRIQHSYPAHQSCPCFLHSGWSSNVWFGKQCNNYQTSYSTTKRMPGSNQILGWYLAEQTSA